MSLQQIYESSIFVEEIEALIFLKQEGGYWDFKREWHSSKGTLLHDIICMSNNLCNRSAYIIIGVDQENDYSIVDVQSDCNRRNTQQIVDFLKDKKFAGDIRPIVRVESVVLYKKGTIDVIIIENSHSTPFYLTKDFECVRGNYIYTRIMDTNTPVDRSADIDKVELLWKKRFCLDETPLARICSYLQEPQKWETSPDENEGIKFYNQFPEFTLREKYDESRNGYAFYIFGQEDTSPHWATITLCYHQTVLKQFGVALLDGYRCRVIVPGRDGVFFSDGYHLIWDVSYVYYVKGSIQYLLQQFLNYDQNREHDHIFNHYLRCVLVFESEQERECFNFYLKENEETYRTLFKEEDGIPIFPELAGVNLDYMKKEYRDALVLRKMLERFRG